MLAFEKAYEAGFSSFETDVTILKDNTPVLFHDYTFERLSGINKNINDSSIEDIKSVDVGSFKSKEFASCLVPLLKDLLLFAKKNNIKINLELKGRKKINKYLWSDIVTHSHNTVLEYGCEDIVFYSSFEMDMLRKLKKLDSNASFGILFNQKFSDWQVLSKELNPISINFKENTLTEAFVHNVKSEVYSIYTHTLMMRKEQKSYFLLV